MGVEDKDQPSNFPHVTLGINLAVGMALFTFLGNWIDKKTGDQHFWILIGIFLGLFYCGYEIWKLIRRSNNDHKDNMDIQTNDSKNK